MRHQGGPGGRGATGTVFMGLLRHSSVGQEAEAPEAQRKQGAHLGTWVAGAKPAGSGLWEGLRSLADLSQPLGGWSTIRGGGQAAAKEQDSQLEPLGAPRHHAVTARAGATRRAIRGTWWRA